MVEPAPAPPLVVAQPHLLLELLEIPFEAPAQLGWLDQVSKRRVRRQGREPVFRRLLLPLRPLDQDPFLSSGLMQQEIAGAGRTRTAAKRDVSGAFVPSRPVTAGQA